MKPVDLHGPTHAEYSFIDPVTGAEGWLVIDSLVEGLAFGGCRFHPGVTLDEVRELARCMTWKLAGHGLPTGGAKAGLALDPNHRGCEDVLTRFVEHMRAPLLSHAMLGKDMGATDHLLDHLYTTLGVPQMHIAHQTHGQNGIPGRLRDLSGYCSHMTGRGVAVAASRAISRGIEGARIGIQGFGLVGAGSAHRLAERGAHIVAIADQTCAVFSDALPLSPLVQRGRALRRIDRTCLPKDCQSHPSAKILESEVDILVLAAGSHVVGSNEASTIRAPLVVEGANFALTPGAREVLHGRGVTVIPDVIASSASAALVSHQMACGNTLTDAECWQRIDGAIEATTSSSLARARLDGVTVRQAYLKALSE